MIRLNNGRLTAMPDADRIYLKLSGVVDAALFASLDSRLFCLMKCRIAPHIVVDVVDASFAARRSPEWLAGLGQYWHSQFRARLSLWCRLDSGCTALTMARLSEVFDIETFTADHRFTDVRQPDLSQYYPTEMTAANDEYALYTGNTL